MFLLGRRGSCRLYLPGAANNYAWTADANVLDITGDIEIRVACALADWTPSATSVLLGKWSTAGNLSYQLNIQTGGEVRLTWSADGTAQVANQSSAAPTVKDGAILLVRSTLDVNDGSGNRVGNHYTKSSTPRRAYADLADDSGWVKLGNTVTAAGTTSIKAGNGQLQVGAANGGALANGSFYGAIVYNGIGGTRVFDVDFTARSLAHRTVMTDRSNNATVTIATSGRNGAVITAARTGNA